MKKTTITLLLTLFLCSPILAQEKSAVQNEKCLSDSYNAELLLDYPTMMGGKSFKLQLATEISKIQANSNANRRVVISIPLVVHVLHNGEPIGTGANISDAQVLSQVTVMNQDFRMMMGTAGESTAGGVDVEVEFIMAKRTPNDCPTNGINRVNICQDGTNSAAEVNAFKSEIYWDAANYMNMYSSKYVGSMSGLLGYAQFPGGPAATDGVSSGHTYFGSSDYDDGSFTLIAPYDKGRTMTHEVGHYLGLYHTFQGGCSATGDEVADTPAVSTPNYNCPTGTDSCPSLAGVDMIENYMDYTDDLCMNTFTQGQKDRVQAVLASATNRASLASSNGATPLNAVANDAEITIECLAVSDCSREMTAQLKITNWGTSALSSATISYNIDGSNASNYNWTGTLAYGEYDTITLPTVTSTEGAHTLNSSIINTNGTNDARACNNVDSKDFSIPSSFAMTTQVNLTLLTDDYCEETTWEFKDESGTVIYSGGPYIQDTQDNTTFNETFNINPNQCYTFTINDSQGDGICCDYGSGSYDLKTDDDTLIFEGGTFAFAESTTISTASLNVDEYILESSFSLYPNPVSNELNIKVSNNQLPISYNIYNMLGQALVSKTIKTASDLYINTSSYDNGIYFIKIYNSKTSVSIPFIKE